MKNEFKNGFKKEAIMFISLTLVSVLMAFNLKSFVRTGGLFPGGFSGLAILLQQIAGRVFPCQNPVFGTVSAIKPDSGIHRIQVYRQAVYAVFVLRGISVRYLDGPVSGHYDHL